MSSPSEEVFETAICDWLRQHGGYVAVKNDLMQGEPRDFDAVRGLDTAELFTFNGATQGNEWAELVSRYGEDPDRAQVKYADRLASELDKRGVVDVLRHGVVDQGIMIRAAYFKPAHGLSPDLVDKYDANRFTAPVSFGTTQDPARLSTWRSWSTRSRSPRPSSRTRSRARVSSRRSAGTGQIATRRTAPAPAPSCTSRSTRCGRP